MKKLHSVSATKETVNLHPFHVSELFSEVKLQKVDHQTVPKPMVYFKVERLKGHLDVTENYYNKTVLVTEARLYFEVTRGRHSDLKHPAKAIILVSIQLSKHYISINCKKKS